MGTLKEIEDLFDFENKKTLAALIPSSALLILCMILFIDIYTNRWLIHALDSYSPYYTIPLMLSFLILALYVNLCVTIVVIGLIVLIDSRFRPKNNYDEFPDTIIFFWSSLIVPFFLLSFLFPMWLTAAQIVHSNIIGISLVLSLIICFVISWFMVFIFYVGRK